MPVSTEDTTTATDGDATSPDESSSRSGRRRRSRRGRRGRGRSQSAESTTESTADQPKAEDAGDGDKGSGDDSAKKSQSDGPETATDRAESKDSQDGRKAADDTTADKSSGDQTKDGKKDGDKAKDGNEDAPEPSDKDASGTAAARSGTQSSGNRRKRKSGSKSGGRSDNKPSSRSGNNKDDSDKIRQGGTRLAAKQNRGGGRGRRPGGVSEEVRRMMLEGPPKTMLVSVDDERTQIAVLEERTLVEHSVTRRSDTTLVGNIYMARVQNVLPGMEAAFLDIGQGRNGVLYAGEVLYDDLDIEEGDPPRIEDALQSGQKVLVQVTKDAMGTKGPRLTMQLSLAGRYTVLAPNSDVFGISRKLTDKERDRLRKIVKNVKPDQHGVIVRTAAEGIPEEQLVADIQRLLRKWEGVEARAEEAKALTSVYEEPPLHVKVIRDSFGPGYEKCIIDDLEVHDGVKGYLDEVAPDLATKIELYGVARYERDHADDEPAAEEGTDGDRPRFAPLFDAYNVNEQLRKAMARKVWLPSGGYLIIESTEAMKVIDVNTGKYTGSKKTSLEEVVLKTNLEAAKEIVRQLRLRDIGGIIIIDFIDMLLKANQDQVVRTLKRELLRDRTKSRVSEVSKLGLVQMTRKNVSAGLIESYSHTCDKCDGRGWINDFDS